MKGYGIGNLLILYAVSVKRTSLKKVSLRLDGVIDMDRLSVTLVLNIMAMLLVPWEVSIELAGFSNMSFYFGLLLLGFCQYCGLAVRYHTHQVCSTLSMIVERSYLTLFFTQMILT